MESNDRFFRRRANEEMKAASRAVTEAARERQMRLAGICLERLKTSQQGELLDEPAAGSLFSGAAGARSNGSDGRRPNRPDRPFITL